MKVLFACLKMLGFAVACLIVVPVQLSVLLITKGPGSFIVPRLWHRAVCLVFRIRFRVQGTPVPADQQTLFISNHLSYLDIPVIGSILTASFVAKKEVQSWPLFGFLSELQQTQFLDRTRHAIGREAKSLEGRIDSGVSMIIFAEGTSTDGRAVLPFKSSLFSLALTGRNPDMCVQPVTLRLRLADGRPPQTQEDRDLYAWHRDMDTPLHEHLWRFALHGGADIDVIFHEPLKASAFADRKILADTCHSAVSKGLETALAA